MKKKCEEEMKGSNEKGVERENEGHGTHVHMHGDEERHTKSNGISNSHGKIQQQKHQTHRENEMKNKIVLMKNKKRQTHKRSEEKILTQKNASIHTVYCSFHACYSYLFIANGKISLALSAFARILFSTL